MVGVKVRVGVFIGSSVAVAVETKIGVSKAVEAGVGVAIVAVGAMGEGVQPVCSNPRIVMSNRASILPDFVISIFPS
jgi:hypothetical protein